jgi:ABC-type lipoprotein release transport system permease subunit
MVSFSVGMSAQRARDQIQTRISHIQIHHPDYEQDQEVEKTLGVDTEELLQTAQRQVGVEAVTGRTLAKGMISSPRKSSGVQILGVMPEYEARTTQLDQQLTDGSYFDEKQRLPIIIGERLAEQLKTGLRKKLVLTFQDAKGEMVAGAFRVAGIYRSADAKYDERHVFVRAADLQNLLGIPGEVHEVAILAGDREQVAGIQAGMQEAYPSLLVENWKELSPELRLLTESMDQVVWIFVGIIVLALAFGIINTMLMAVMERTHELGMLMAVGMNKPRVFSMIMLETFYLSLVGAPIGLLGAWGTVSFFGKVGIDLSAFSQGMAELGMSSMVYTQLDPKYYLQVFVIVAITAFLSAIYPAIKALSLKPMEAVRTL